VDLSPSHLLASYGVIGIGVVLFLETGVLLGIVLPGETLTVIAGAYSHSSGPSGTHPSLLLVMLAAGAGAVAGGQMGFFLGRRAGPRLFDRPDSLLFRRSYLERTREYFRRFGKRAILIGRFVPILRTFVSPAAGVGGMPAATFVRFNLLGGIAWAIVVATIGYIVGGLVSIDKYALVVTVVIAVVSLIPLIHELRAMRTQRPGAQSS
jgi:membrane-associated protein